MKAVLRVPDNRRRPTSAILAAAAAAVVIAGATAPSAVASPVGGGGTVFTFPDVSEPPSVVSGLPSGAVQVAANIAGQFGMALLPDGNVWAWSVDSNTGNFGELGDGTTTDRTNPEPVHNLGWITYIAAGSAHALAVGSGGSVWTWGDNADGELGDGTTVNRSLPAQVPGLTGVTQVAGGADFSMALRSDGTVWAWGGNEDGQLGDGTTTSRSTPQQVPGLTGITWIAVGNSISFAVGSDWTLFDWGRNAGMLGNGSVNDPPSISRPQPVPGLTGVTRVAAGLFHVVAVAGPSRTVWSWGGNDDGQLGDGTTISHYSPEPIALSNVILIGAGDFDSGAVQSDGTLLGWAGAGRLTPTVNTDVVGVTSMALGNEPNLVIGRSAFVPVPDLTGDGRAQAATALQNAGFVLGSVGSVVDNSCNNIGVVFSQSPDAGTSLHLGSAVSITLGVRPRHGCP